MTETQLIAEIKGDYEQYDSEGLISTTTIVNEMRNAISEFGNDVIVNKDDVLTIDNYKSELPTDFWAINNATLIDVNGVDCNEKMFALFKEDNILRPWQNLCNNCSTDRKIQKRYAWGIVTLRYNNEQALDIVRPFRVNRYTTKYTEPKNEVCISNRNMHAKFKEGSVYYKYRALPTTEDGELYVEESDSGSLVEYVKTRVSREVLHKLILTGKAPDMVQMLGYLTQRERDLHIKASADVKMKNLGSNVMSKQRPLARAQARKYGG